MCRCEGFLDVEFKYLGGLWVLFEFSSHEARDKFFKHKGVLLWFSSLKPWHDDFVVKERLIWIENKGVPLRGWDNDILLKFETSGDSENSVNDDVGSMDKYEGQEENLMGVYQDVNLMEDNEEESVADSIHGESVPLMTVIEESNQEKEHVYEKTENTFCAMGNDEH
uniref:Reverse transcriptase domain, reverse transcriptase zinc-binding domain protein n=1 Tax=Tanacetum cinerariifolium TaxID=118510 RepID=A0A699J5S8_TANCI|nr:reverse transcriptase domain, reverse transcriptase zinc-binding domain protein [Tanacetum cinerariifolium]